VHNVVKGRLRNRSNRVIDESRDSQLLPARDAHFFRSWPLCRNLSQSAATGSPRRIYLPHFLEDGREARRGARRLSRNVNG